ncbi:DNA-directed RNA polymerase beta' subunit [Staphylococcus phage Machias]|nr:DNA-directed RNA polymerase beta' subunit [Staphylococcus phage Machias]
MSEEKLVLDLKLGKYNNYLHSDNYYEIIEELKQDIINNPKDRMNDYFEDNISKSNYLTLLILGKPFREMNKKFTEEYLVNPTNINEYYDYFDKIVVNFIKEGHDPIKISQSIAYIIDELTIFSNEYILPVDGPSISLYDIMRLANEDKEIERLINFDNDDIDPNLTYQQIINEVQKPNMDNLIKHIKMDKENDYKTFLESGTGINKIQLNEVLSFVGFKPDIRGDVVTDIIDTSFMRGLKNTTQFAIDAESSLNALMNSKNKVRESGYLNRKITLLTSDLKLSDNHDCGSKHLLYFNVDSQEKLDRINDRYYYDDNDQEFKLIDSRNDVHLIGQIVPLRSPITCAEPNGKICQMCYGRRLYDINRNLAVGIIATLQLTEPMTQKLLSTKHLQAVQLSEFSWSDIFNEHFEFSGDNIIPRDEKTKVIIDDMIINEDIDYGKYKAKSFKFKIGTKVHEVKSPVILRIPDQKFDSIEKFYNEDENAYVFNMKDLGENFLFNIKIKNEGVADPLLKIRSILERSNFIKNDYEEKDYQRMFNDVMDLLLKSGTDVMSVHVETIIRNMVFLNDTIYKDRVKYKDPDFNPKITLRNVGNSILNSPSPVHSLIFENVRAQLTTDETNGFFSKDDESMFDPLFDFDI